MTNDRHSIIKAFIAVAVLGGVASVSAPAQASPVFPGEVRKHLNLSCVPQCTLCHSVNPGVLGTAAGPKGTKFGTAFWGTGKVKLGDASSVGPALDQLGTDMTDSDGKDANGSAGGPDILQIQANSNPSQNGESICGPTYGCGAHVAPQSPFNNWGTLLAAVFVGGVGLSRFRFRKGKAKSGEKA